MWSSDKEYFFIKQIQTNLGAKSFAVIAVLKVPSLALVFLDLLDDGEEDGVLAVLTVVLRAPAVPVVTADVVTSLKIKF